jgi:hypothetical protein
MDKLKVPMCLSVREIVWKGLKGVADREGEKLSQIAELLLEWGVIQLRTAGSTVRLLNFVLRPRNTKPQS